MSVEIGKKAEDCVADWLEQKGYKVLDRNWRTPFCEIDIVARRGKVVSFVEVKYRKSAAYGTGFEYITPDKTRRLRRAATAWVAKNGFTGDYQVDIASVAPDGGSLSVEYLPNAL
ncbi:MAG TPA: YraN family protein [Candidatus Dormibacteraeota bacterium]|nr:YraN family protein [Candidatus Dormibacteraeota bacterium]